MPVFGNVPRLLRAWDRFYRPGMAVIEPKLPTRVIGIDMSSTREAESSKSKSTADGLHREYGDCTVRGSSDTNARRRVSVLLKLRTRGSFVLAFGALGLSTGGNGSALAVPATAPASATISGFLGQLDGVSFISATTGWAVGYSPTDDPNSVRGGLGDSEWRR
jgi:hypothetical protein